MWTPASKAGAPKAHLRYLAIDAGTPRFRKAASMSRFAEDRAHLMRAIPQVVFGADDSGLEGAREGAREGAVSIDDRAAVDGNRGEPQHRHIQRKGDADLGGFGTRPVQSKICARADLSLKPSLRNPCDHLHLAV